MSFLRRLFSDVDNPFRDNFVENRLRPPGAVEEKRFMALCIRCNRCLEVCPFTSIKREGFSATLGTPYVYAETKACYLCMACTRLCPTGALDKLLIKPENVKMGKAVIDKSICYSHLFLEHDVVPDESGSKIGALCNTCYNICPLQDKAIILRDNLFPEITDHCVGCGICTERCPTRPRRAINIIPSGMGRTDEAGFWFQKAHKHYHSSSEATKDAIPNTGPLKGEQLLEKKRTLGGDEPTFKSPFDILDIGKDQK